MSSGGGPVAGNARDEGFMRHAQEQDLEQYLLGRLKDRQAATAKSNVADGESYGGKLAGSLRSAKGVDFSFGHPFTGAEKRREPRIPVKDAALMRKIAPFIDAEYTLVRILDASKNGLKVHTSAYLELETIMQLRFSSNFV